ncbi:MAG TPA: aminopeptidase P family protein [Dehalococcoidales bacterium]|nr:aminopeptidase P family protein [Dehalococcoidales bacterium]
MRVTNRLSQLREKLVQQEIDAIFVSQPDNRRYLSGFDGSAGYLLITGKDAIIATDFRYIEQVKQQSPDYRVFQISGDMANWFSELVVDLRGRKLGFELQHMSLAMYRQVGDIIKRVAPPPRLVPLEGLVESLRAIKEAEEIEVIAQAADISDRAFRHVEENIKAGMTEIEVAWEVERFMREHGSQAVPFDVIVASGPNAALPHARPSERAIQKGEPVLMDIGARVHGYASDLTRTICLGEPDNDFKKVYDIVLGAQLAALELIKEGMTGEQADDLARTVIAEAGYAEAFGHALGHGVGLVAHEAPRLGPGSSEKLTSGMVFTIEPGIYLPGWGGVRIEDLVVPENGQLRILSKARKT